MIIRDVSKLRPLTRRLILQGIECYVEKYKKTLWINETLRTVEIQTAYYSQGRNTQEETNRLRKIAGLGETQDRSIITNTKGTDNFPHKYGIAIDIYPTLPNGNVNWEAKFSEWEQIADCMKSRQIEKDGYIYRLEWGGDWKGFVDCPHYQIYRVNLASIKENWKVFAI